MIRSAAAGVVRAACWKLQADSSRWCSSIFLVNVFRKPELPDILQAATRTGGYTLFHEGEVQDSGARAEAQDRRAGKNSGKLRPATRRVLRGR